MPSCARRRPLIALLWKAADAPTSVDEEENVSGIVPLVLSLSLDGPVTFGAFTPGVAKDYNASATVTATSTAPGAALTIADSGHRRPSATWSTGAAPWRSRCRSRRAVPLAMLGGSATPTTLKTWSSPLANELVALPSSASRSAPMTCS